MTFDTIRFMDNTRMLGDRVLLLIRAIKDDIFIIMDTHKTMKVNV